MTKKALNILVFSDVISTRLIYTLNFISENQNFKIKTTNDVKLFEASDELKIVYSDRYFEANYLQISPCEVLFQDGVDDFSYQWKDNEKDSKKLLIDEKDDVFAAVFAVLTNYRDYLVDAGYRDKHNRVPAKYNLLYQGGVHKELMIERWIRDFVDQVNLFYNSEIEWIKQPISVQPTFDIDLAFAYLEKPLWRNVLSKGLDSIKNDKDRKTERQKVIQNLKKDPFDTFDYISALRSRDFSPILFWLLGDYSKFDKNLAFDNKTQIALIKSMEVNTDIGIHPSYKSNEDFRLLTKEVNRLESILSEKVTKSRQHFLKLEFPQTYQRLIKLGVKEDYSLGFAETTGFRVGTIRPHFWYDLLNDEVTDLVIHPFSYMDGTLKEYQNLSIEEAKSEVSLLFKEIKQFGGEFSFIWHNSTIGDYGKWKGWRSVLEHSLNLKSEIE